MTPPTNNLPADQAARIAALDPARSFIVQAPAGSGKTDLLTKRYLRLLATVERPEQVLAITFTRKAAAEMRQRIVQALHQKTPASGMAEQAHEKQLRALAVAVRKRDAEKGWQLAAHPARLRIQTIDSLNLELTRQLPLLARFGSQPQITERPAALYAEAARRTLEAVASDAPGAPMVATLLAHLDNDWLRAHELLVNMLPRRDQWLPRLGAAPDRAALENALRREVDYQLQRVRAAVPAEHAGELVALAAYAAGQLRQQAAKPSPILACEQLNALPAADSDSLPAWQGLAELLLTKEGKWRKRFTKNEGFPPEDKDEKARITELRQQFLDNEALLAQLNTVRRLPLPRFADVQWEMLDALVGLLPVAVAQLQVVFGEQGQVDFPEMALRALQALGDDNETPSDLLLRLDAGIQHILVDEFQDTSLSQYRLLERLVAGWNENDGRSLFVVGDPMQSIYRFREAEVGLYLRTRQHGLQTVRLQPLQLKTNFRSRPALVDWVNTAFSNVLPEAEDMASGAVPHAQAVAHRESVAQSSVQMHAALQRDDAAEARNVVACLEQARTFDPAARCAILVQTRTHLASVLPLLRQRGIRYHAVEIERLGHQVVVQDLLALTRALLHEGDRTAWLATLRAPWCGLSLRDLDMLASGGEASTLAETLADAERCAALSTDGAKRAARFAAELSQARQNRQRRGLRDSVEALWLALNGPACLPAAVALDDAMAYFGLLESLEAGGDLAESAQLEQQLADLFAPPDPEADDSVQLLTIHKAKGLEFDIVLVPGLGRAPRRDEPRLLLWLERPRAQGAADLLFAPLGPVGADADPVYAFVRALEQERGSFEQGRLLYVAATRAREQLHLFGHVGVREDNEGNYHLKQPAGQSLLAVLWLAVEQDFVRALEHYTPPAAVQQAKQLQQETGPWRLPANWQAPELPPGVPELATQNAVSEADATPEFSWAGESARLVGTLVHRVLQQMARTGQAGWDAARIAKLAPLFTQLLQQQGVPPEICAATVARAQEALRRVLADPRSEWLLFTAHQDARAEYAVQYWEANTLRTAILDRTFIDEQGVRWIVDYKTGSHGGGDVQTFLARERERYAPQLERYARLMQQREPQRPLRVALYYPLLGEFLEWEPELT